MDRPGRAWRYPLIAVGKKYLYLKLYYQNEKSRHGSDLVGIYRYPDGKQTGLIFQQITNVHGKFIIAQQSTKPNQCVDINYHWCDGWGLWDLDFEPALPCIYESGGNRFVGSAFGRVDNEEEMLSIRLNGCVGAYDTTSGKWITPHAHQEISWDNSLLLCNTTGPDTNVERCDCFDRSGTFLWSGPFHFKFQNASGELAISRKDLYGQADRHGVVLMEPYAKDHNALWKDMTDPVVITDY